MNMSYTCLKQKLTVLLRTRPRTDIVLFLPLVKAAPGKSKCHLSMREMLKNCSHLKSAKMIFMGWAFPPTNKFCPYL